MNNIDILQENHIIEIKEVFPLEKKINIFIKCLLIGSSGVGKSSILERYSSNVFVNHFITTIGVDYKLKNISLDNYNIKLQLWDTASQERFRCITSNYYKNSQIIIVCFDITDIHSFTELEFWIEDATKHINEPVKMAICGTKSDLQIQRVISYNEGKNYADYKNLPYFEISSKNNTGIDDMFETILKCKLTENDFYKLTQEHKISNEKYDVLTIKYPCEYNYYGSQQTCCYLY